MTYYLFHECGEFIDYFDDHAEAVNHARNHCIKNRDDFLIIAMQTDYINFDSTNNELIHSSKVVVEKNHENTSD